jgi:hypothetical protein
MPDVGHPCGYSDARWFRFVGDKLRPDRDHPDGYADDNWFRIIGDTIRPDSPVRTRRDQAAINTGLSRGRASWKLRPHRTREVRALWWLDPSTSPPRTTAFTSARRCTRAHVTTSAARRFCPVTVQQSVGEVEGALVDWISRNVATEELLDEVLAEIRDQLKAQMPKRDADIAALEAELRDVRAEQKRLGKKNVALADDLPELVTELRQRNVRIRQIEGRILTAKKTPDELAKLVKQIEIAARTKLAHAGWETSDLAHHRRR